MCLKNLWSADFGCRRTSGHRLLVLYIYHQLSLGELVLLMSAAGCSVVQLSS